VDGVRVMWNGDYLYTTQGIVIHPPAEWKKSLPQGYLDGALMYALYCRTCLLQCNQAIAALPRETFTSWYLC